MGKLIDRTGHVYGRLTVLSRYDDGPASNGRRTRWLCRCECGTEKIAVGHELASGDTNSCGCFRREIVGAGRRTHGKTRSYTHTSWRAAKDRCFNCHHTKFADYGGRGIIMCEAWATDFAAFLRDMGERPRGMTLDRIDNSKGYEPGNCRWAPIDAQAANRRSNIEWRGALTTIKSVAEEIGVPRTSLNKLIRSGLSVEAAVAHAISHRR